MAAGIAKNHAGLCLQKVDEQTIKIGLDRQACDEAVVNTAYVYEQYRHDPENLDTYVAGLMDSASSAIAALNQQPAPLDRSRLVAVIRPAAYRDYMRSESDSSGGIWRHFVGDLIAVLVQKDGEQSRSLTSAELKELRLTEPEAWKLALSNLRAQIGPLKVSANDQGAEVITADSGLAASNLLLSETCRSDGQDFDAFVVARDTYFSASQQRPAATAMLASYSAQLVRSGDETYSDTLISCIRGRWYASVFDGDRAWRPAEGGG